MTSDITLADKTIIVTGASRGIGEAIARACARAGANVVLASRKQEGVDAAAATITAGGGSALAVACHMGQAEDVTALFGRAAEEFGTIHGLVNNAATNPYFGPMLAIEDSAFDKTIEVNLKGPLAASRGFAGQAPAGGSIVNVASVAGLGAAPLQGVYGMTKAALISMTQTLAHELGPMGVRVNAVAPGLVETRFASALIQNEELLKHVVERTPVGRHGQPDEIAGAVVYLLSDAAAFMTGQVMTIDGGWSSG
ncbi:MAG: glucose 1-dehydrogenase [Acidimicrobiia bacterium]|nr:glucose 1-dehydrogenase [Acidimicrobiia bacterium]NNF88825.1 glucose 1-dehydrogenase [Acidimicrobiia bacterium]NNL13931.1 glucose 1-dehydrogenase [Acidimicrobiia bacterium]RZV47251.1 MAG: glucose 1-dehydrogenase [Acidimicrobiia bacterium]